MQELIPLQLQTINGNTVETVSARELHAFLESKQDFSTWIKNRISEYDFVENQDFVRFHKKMEANNATLIEYYITFPQNNEKGRPSQEYFITLDMAKDFPFVT